MVRNRIILSVYKTGRMRFIRFVLEFLKHPRQVGALAQSSRFLAEKMAREMGTATSVVEFGPGTGSITKYILKHLPENGRLTSFEINPRFCKDLKKIHDSRLSVINDVAQNYPQHVDRYDCIVSGLPLRSFTKSQREEILAVSTKCKTYIQFQYMPLLGSDLRRHFKDVKVKFVLFNFPPAFVYISKNPISQPLSLLSPDSQTLKAAVPIRDLNHNHKQKPASKVSGLS